LFLETVVHCAEVDGVNVCGRYASVIERLLRDLGDQGFRIAFAFPEFAVRPTCDANGHVAFLFYRFRLPPKSSPGLAGGGLCWAFTEVLRSSKFPQAAHSY
jgi:hypothetical protein